MAYKSALLLTILLSIPFGQVGARAAEDPALKRFRFRLPQVQLDGTEIPMFGRWKSANVNIGGSDKPREIWIKEVRTKVFDVETGEDLPDYLCHSHLGENGFNSWLSMRFFGNQGGTPDTVLPDGFAVPVKISAKRPILFYAMVADSAQRGLKKKVRPEMDIAYYDAKDAKKLGIKPLEVAMTFGSAGNELGGTLNDLWDEHHPDEVAPKNHKKSHEQQTVRDRYNHVHWFVPPGKFDYRTPLNKQVDALKTGDIRVFQIHAHAHAYATAYQLYDVTDKKVLFNGKVETFPDRTVVKSVEHFVSPEGIVLKKDHQYEMAVQYDNPGPKPTGAMLTWRMFFQRIPGQGKPTGKQVSQAALR